ncbi:hypothetical protein IV500_19710, partial [Paeniglutamicibacter antarcticus]|nr:hypothetical protein [Arthrobacter terrae]
MEIDRENLARVLAAVTAKYPHRLERAGLSSGPVPAAVPGTGSATGSGPVPVPGTVPGTGRPDDDGTGRPDGAAGTGGSDAGGAAGPGVPAGSPVPGVPVDGPVGEALFVVGPSAGIVGRLEQMNVLLAEVLGTDPQAVSQEAWLSIIGAAESTRRRLDAVYLHSVAAADQCGAAGLSGIGTKNMREYLVHGVGVEPGRAKADV